jgi:hypothetical protein
MLESLLGGLIDKEKAIATTIKESLKEVAKELKCSHNELFIMIKPTDDKMNFKNWIYKHENGKPPKLIREITLKEIIGE